MSHPRNALALAAALLASAALAPTAAAKTHVVHPGHSIQAAIDAASPGDKIVIAKGTYRESLEIAKDGITLKGEKAKLAPPATAPTNPCTQNGPMPGICIHGQGNFGTGQVTKRVSDVRIKGLAIKGFPGDGAFAIWADGFRVDHDKLLKNGGYGVFSLNSLHVRYTHDLSRGNGDAGFYVGESPDVHAVVEHDKSVGNHGEGILLRSITFAEASHNTVAKNCGGILGLADAPGPATHLDINHNRVRKNNRACAGEGEDEPPKSGFGIVLLGAADSVVAHNEVAGQNASGPSLVSGGIVVQKGVAGTPPTHDKVKHNHAENNKPDDLHWDGSGSVTFAKNKCGKSDPASLCAKGGKKGG